MMTKTNIENKNNNDEKLCNDNKMKKKKHKLSSLGTTVTEKSTPLQFRVQWNKPSLFIRDCNHQTVNFWSLRTNLKRNDGVSVTPLKRYAHGMGIIFLKIALTEGGLVVLTTAIIA